MPKEKNLQQKKQYVKIAVRRLDFRPFRAWRYHLGRVELGQVIAPPYDVISLEEQEVLYARSPYNVVRLILGKEANFYDEARRSWEKWVREGILLQDERPAFYLYEQVFRLPSDPRPRRRLALVGTLKLEDSELILSHEVTLPEPKRDRLQLLQKTRTNLSPIFGLFEDSKKALTSVTGPYRDAPALFEATDSEGVIHRGWSIESQKDQQAIRGILSGEKILIADGHHRYETALEYRRQMRERLENEAGEEPFDFVMTALVELEDEGLLVLPTHRILRSFGRVPKEKFLDELRLHFDFFPCPAEKLYSELSERSREEKLFGGIFKDQGSFILRLKDLPAVRRALAVERPSIWYEIEANLLTYFVLEVLGELGEEERRRSLEYPRSAEEAIRAVQEDRAEAAFLLRPPRVQAIRRLAETGERMPEKTTYFYPKLASGLFFYHHG